MKVIDLNESRDSSVGIALGYRQDDWGSRVRFPAGAGNFSLHHRVKNGSEAHPASYPMGTTGSFPGDKAAGAWSWPLTSIWCRGQRTSGAIHPLPQYAFMAWCSVKAQGQLYLTLIDLNVLMFREYEIRTFLMWKAITLFNVFFDNTSSGKKILNSVGEFLS
jgi:hypothetical protein